VRRRLRDAFIATPSSRPLGAGIRRCFGAEARTWHFDEDRPEQLPAKFTIGTLKALRPPNVFAQHREKGAEHHYNVMLIDLIQAANLDLSVSSLPISGKVDVGGALIWRAADDRNYYLIRANPLEQNKQQPIWHSDG